MSQYRFTTTKDGQKIEVQAGWDRPLKQVFLLVEVVGPDEDEGNDILYNSLLDPVPSPEDVGEILRNLGLPVPKGLVEGIAHDQAVNMGNKVVNFGEVG